MVNVACHYIKKKKKKTKGNFCTGVSGKKPNRLEVSANKSLFLNGWPQAAIIGEAPLPA